MQILYESKLDFIIPNFKARELMCPCCGLIEIDYRMLPALLELRKSWGAALSLLSVCRCPDHNNSDGVSGHPNSLHQTKNPTHNCSTCATDINVSMYSSELKFNLFKLLRSHGWSVGLKENSIHADLRCVVLKFPAKVFFYGSKIPNWYSKRV